MKDVDVKLKIESVLISEKCRASPIGLMIRQAMKESPFYYKFDHKVCYGNLLIHRKYFTQKVSNKNLN